MATIRSEWRPSPEQRRPASRTASAAIIVIGSWRRLGRLLPDPPVRQRPARQGQQSGEPGRLDQAIGNGAQSFLVLDWLPRVQSPSPAASAASGVISESTALVA